MNKKERRIMKKQTIWIKFKATETGKNITSVRMKKVELKLLKKTARSLGITLNELVESAIISLLYSKQEKF